MNPQFKFKVFGILIMAALLLGSLPTARTQAQTGGEYVCGQWSFTNGSGRLSGWWFNPWPFDGQHPSWVMRNIPSGWSSDMNGAYTRIWHPTLDESYSLGPLVLDIGSYEVVPGCDSGPDLSKVRIAPVVNAILPLSSACLAEVALSIDRTNMPSDWQQAIATAGQTWAQAGSGLKFSTRALTDQQRIFTAVDFDGQAINVNNQPLTLAQCEIRVFRASSLPGTYIVSFEKTLPIINQKRTYSLELAGWAQQFTRDGRVADAVLVILNDRNLRADVSLSTHPGLANQDVESVALHEIGHALGLPHILVNNFYDEKSVMMLPGDKSDFDKVVIWSGVLRRFLYPLDLKAIQAAFPPTSRPAKASQPTAQPTTSQPTQAKISNEIYFVALRKSPGYSNKNNETDILASIPAGEFVQILRGPEKADGLNWWNVSWGGTQGWVADHTGSGKTVLLFLP